MSNKRLGNQAIISAENIKRNIRHALSEKRNPSLLNVNTTTPAFLPSEDLTIDFVQKFRESGGIFVPCVKNDFAPRLTQLLKVKNMSAYIVPIPPSVLFYSGKIYPF